MVRNGLAVINPALHIQELPPEKIKRARLLVSMVFVGFLVFLLVKNFLIAKNRTRSSLMRNGANKFSILIHMIFTELMPIPYTIILLMDFQCRNSLSKESRVQTVRSEASFSQRAISQTSSQKDNFASSCPEPGYLGAGPISILDGIELLLFILITYRLKEINFDQRIKNRTFGAK